MCSAISYTFPDAPRPVVDDPSLYQLAEQLGNLLHPRGRRVSTAESCTGGWIAQTITAVPGSSAWFDQGVVTYANIAKQRLLGVPPQILEGPQAPGAVSEPTVLAMARGALSGAAAHLAVASSGLAGPGGGGEGKPVGTVWLGWAWLDGDSQAMDVMAQARCYHLQGGRELVRRQTVSLALLGLIALASADKNTG